MRSILPRPHAGPEQPGPGLRGGEIVVVVVVMALAVALALAGLPMFGVIEFLGGVAYLACLTVKGLRDPRPVLDEGI